MRLTIFTRLVAGYLALFLLVLAVSVYAIVRLHQMESLTRTILQTDNHLIGMHKKLTDSLLDQAVIEKKYIILKDRSLYDRFTAAARGFRALLDEAVSMPVDERQLRILRAVGAAHENYLSLVREESDFLARDVLYAQKKYAEEKAKLVDSMVRRLSELKVLTETRMGRKIQLLSTMGRDARRAAILIAAAALAVALLISIVITRSITTPLTAMKARAAEIAAGRLDGELKIASPPEMGELAQTLNYMCGRLKEIDTMKSDFFAVMSHELRTPLTSIREGTNLLLEGVAGEASQKQRRLLTIISDESNRLIELVNSFLTMAKIEAGMMTYEFTRGDLAELVRKVMREMEPLAAARRIRLETAEGSTSPLWVRMDGEKMLQVLRNLIGNALKYTPEGGTVTLEARRLGRQVRVEVADTGPGLTPAEIAVIFDRYRQARTASGQARSTGLGLSIVRSVIQAHGGRVWAESTPGRGSTFVFLVPEEAEAA